MESIGDNDKSDDTKVSDDDKEDSDEDFVAFEEKLDDTDDSYDKRKLLRSGVWEFFDVTDIDNKTATCNLCSEPFSFRTTSTNLAKHLKRKHYIEFEKVVDDDDPSKSRSRVSAAWEYFSIKDSEQRLATCKLCGAYFSYKSSVSNLTKHVQRMHGVMKNSDDEENSVSHLVKHIQKNGLDSTDEEDDDGLEENPFDNDIKKPRANLSLAWKYFTKTDPLLRIATCKLCNEELSYQSTVFNLLKHVRRKHKDCIDLSMDHTDNEKGEEPEENNERKKERSNSSQAWKYFTKTDPENCMATCKLCNQERSYATTVGNLLKHIRVNHNIARSDDSWETGDENVEQLEFSETVDSLPKVKTSESWKYFEKTDPDHRIATCKLCNKELSYVSTLGNLMSHIRSCHKDIKTSKDTSYSDIGSMKFELEDNNRAELKDNNGDKLPGIKPSRAWSYFTKTDPEHRVATCKLCNKELSYLATISNLMKHIRSCHKHIDTTSKDMDHSDMMNEEFLVEDNRTDPENDNIELEDNLEPEDNRIGLEDNDTELEVNNPRKKERLGTSAAWKYFTKTDTERRIATCNLCNKERSYATTVGNLLKHIRRTHNINPFVKSKDTDDENKEEFDFDTRRPTNLRSPIWLYFKVINKLKKKAICLVCKKRLSFESSVTNLKKHLTKQHPQIKLSEASEGKKIIISTDGQVYEIEESAEITKHEKTDDEQPSAIDIDTVFLDDFDGDISIENEKPKSKPQKRPHISQRKGRPWREQVLHEESNSGTDSEITFKKRYVRKKPDSLDKFGTYLISLLRQLPIELSNQLQMDFVKQVMTAHLTYEAQKKLPVSVPATGYAITISEPQVQATDIQYMTVQEHVEISGE